MDERLSQQDIDIIEHCPLVPTFEQAIGYLMYAADFPNRMEINDLIHAMNVLFPEKVLWEWQEFDYFRAMVYASMHQVAPKMDPATRQRLTDVLYFDFSVRIKRWLSRGIEEPDKERDPRTPEQIAESANKELNRKIQTPRKPLHERKYRYEVQVSSNGKKAVVTRRIRRCLACDEVLVNKTKFRFCNEFCEKEHYGMNDPELLSKYFSRVKPITKIPHQSCR